MFELEINVTQDDIDHGERGDCHQCPIAHAMLRALGEARPDLFERAIVYAGGSYLDIESGAVRLRAFTPTKATDFMGDFDYYGRDGVKPFTFRAQFN